MSVKKQDIDINQKCWKFIKDMNSSDEHLDSIAFKNSRRAYTYRQMFYTWDRYAEVFSSLGITGRNNSRVAVTSFAAFEVSCIFYSLNITGAVYASLFSTIEPGSKKWKNAFTEEKITDIVIEDFLLDPEKCRKILDAKEELGLRNIIVIHTDTMISHPTPMVKFHFEENYRKLKRMPGVLFMDDLLQKYEAMPIVREGYKADKVSVIMHTTGSESGKNKPVPFTDRALNAATLRFHHDNTLRKRIEGKRCAVALPLVSAYSLIDQMHIPLSLGCSLAGIALHNLRGTAWEDIARYQINLLFTGEPFIEMWMKMPENTPFDFSSLDALVIGGSYVSESKRKEINAFFNKNGADNIMVANGYGLTETGGAIALSMDDTVADTIGFPLTGVDIRIFDDEDNSYYTLKDGERTGILFVHTDGMTSGSLDGKTYYEFVDIDGKPYFNTNDAVRVNKDRSLSYVGRANRYYVNNAGVRFDASLIETAISAEDGIDQCAMVPMFHKMSHDTVPVLYVVCQWQGYYAAAELRRIMVKVFIEDGLTAKTNLPVKCVFVENLPVNANGKIDIYAIQSEDIKGLAFDIKPIRVDGKLNDIKFAQGDRIDYNFVEQDVSLPDELIEEKEGNINEKSNERREKTREHRNKLMEEKGPDFDRLFNDWFDFLKGCYRFMDSYRVDRKNLCDNRDFEEFLDKRREAVERFLEDKEKNMSERSEKRRKDFEERREHRRERMQEKKPDFDKIYEDWFDFMSDCGKFMDAYRVDRKDLRDNRDFEDFLDKRREAIKDFWEDEEFVNRFKELSFVPVPLPFMVPKSKKVKRRLKRPVAFSKQKPRFVRKRRAKKPFRRMSIRRRSRDLNRLMKVAGRFFRSSPIDYYFER